MAFTVTSKNVIKLPELYKLKNIRIVGCSKLHMVIKTEKTCYKMHVFLSLVYFLHAHDTYMF